jgi:hypothetical protein
MSENEKIVEVQIAELVARIQQKDLAFITAKERGDMVESEKISKEIRDLALQVAKLKGEKIQRPSIWELN